MLMGGEKVLVIFDASRDLNCSGIIQTLGDLRLYPGDELNVLGVLRQVTKPNSRFGEEEFAKKKEQLRKDLEILKDWKKGKIKLDFELEVGPSRKAIAVEVAQNLGATWVILDRVMKKEKKYFAKNLSCKISKLKRNNTIELLRGPLASVSIDAPPSKSPTSNGQVSYDEMIPEQSPKRSPEIQKAPIGKVLDLHACGRPSGDQYVLSSTTSFSDTTNTEASISTASEIRNSSTSFDQEQQNTIRTIDDKNSPYQTPDQCMEETAKTKGYSWKKGLLQTSICSVCENRRPMIGWHGDFNYAELYEATKGFSNENFLGEGGFGSVYKGEVKNGLKVAVKQHKHASLQGEKEFKSEVEVLSKVRHENLVMLLGSCSDGNQRLLVYEYVCNGSLDQHLSKHAYRPLTWEQRMKIALGAAKGLEYLHSHEIVHRDMRPNNILITHDHESLLGDFGLARAQHDNNSDTSVVGTLGYMAPEYAQTGKVSTKTDVYSFGVVLLQLITGRTTTDMIPGGKSLIGWAKPLLKDRNYPDLIDRRIIESHDVLQLFWMVRLTQICISKDPRKRYTMEKVVSSLNSIKDGHTICLEEISPI